MKRLLIANRGEIARRVIRTARAMAIETVAVYAQTDAQALHVREADQAWALGGSGAADSYLDGERLLAAARASGADALHPGYGFLSEDGDFAQAVIDAGLIWVGPPPAAMRALGVKSAAKALAEQLGLPCLPGYAGADQRDARFAAEAQRIGYPLMIKAVAGGGGRGMRLVRAPGELTAALASARAEALAGFGHGDLLIERALLAPRHVEVQLFADAHGHCIHLGERDCSVQRRHQKILEEAPSPAVDEALRAQLGAAAVTLAQAAGYVGAGTVEFLLQEGAYYVMEVNTRLQVEHPVTEMLTGLDLVQWQLRVARGECLPLAQHEIRFTGHAIEARLCAEDEAFTPHAGEVLHFSAPPALAAQAVVQTALRFDHAIEAGLVVTSHFDPMLGKLIAHGPDRASAIARLTQALGQTELLGLPTNRAMLDACLRHPTFRAAQARTSFLDDEAASLRASIETATRALAWSCTPAALLGDAEQSVGLPCPYPRPLRLRIRGVVAELALRERGGGRVELATAPDGQERVQEFMLRTLDAGLVQCSSAGQTHRVRIVCVGPQRWHMQAGAVDWWLEDASYEAPRGGAAGAGAAELRAPCNGRVVALPVCADQRLAAGETALVIESMKLEHNLSSPVPVQVAEVLVSVGQQVSPGQLLLRLRPGTA